MIKTLEYTFDTEIEVLVIGDVHIGDKECDTKLVNKTIDYIKAHDNTRLVLNGDLLNTAIKSSVSFEHGAMSPKSEYRMLVDLLTPVKEKIIGVVSGNHDDRITKETGIDIIEFLCKELGIEDTYCKYQGMLLITCHIEQKRSKLHKIFFTHGIGSGGRQIGSKANFLQRLTGIVSNANCYVVNHTHTPLHFTDKVYYLDSKHKALVPTTRHFINQPSFLTYGGYGQRANFNPCSNYQHLIKLNDKRLEVSNLYIE